MAAVAPRIRRRRTTGAQPVQLGPFSGGLNTAVQADRIAENEVTDLVNLEVDRDGTLVTRPPIARDAQYAGATLHKMLGYSIDVQGAGTGTGLLVAFPEINQTQAYNISSGTWSAIINAAAESFVQYDYKLVMCFSDRQGGYFDLATKAYTVTGSMPSMRQIVYYLGRFWGFGVGANATTLYWSKLSVPGVSSVYDWAPATDYLTVGAGDGQPIVGLIADPSGLIILKTTSTYRFTYASGPTTGTLQTLSTTIGADSREAYAAVENYYVVFCAGVLYQMLQGKYYPLSKNKITFRGTNLENLNFVYSTAVSLFGDRIMLWYYGTLYVYNLTTQTWTTWFCYDAYPAYFFTAPPGFTASGPKVAYVTTGVFEANRRRLYRISEQRYGLSEVNGPDGAQVPGFDWRLVTKTYDFGAPFDYKRLMLWAISLITSAPVHALAYAPTPVQGPIEEDDNTGSLARRRIRVRAAFRFLLASFQVSGKVGNTVPAAAVTRVQAVIPYLSTQADMSAKEA